MAMAETQSKFNSNSKSAPCLLSYGCGHNFKYALGAKTSPKPQKIVLLVTVGKVVKKKKKNKRVQKIGCRQQKINWKDTKKKCCCKHFCVRISLTDATGHSFCRQRIGWISVLGSQSDFGKRAILRRQATGEQKLELFPRFISFVKDFSGIFRSFALQILRTDPPKYAGLTHACLSLSLSLSSAADRID